MFDPDDKETLFAFRRLRDIVKRAEGPLLFWVGAGASRWCGYPSWKGFARALHLRFKKYEPNYDFARGAEALASQRYPLVFQACKQANSQLYFSIVADTLAPKPVTPLYERFASELNLIDPLHIFTTNADEVLERRLRKAAVVQRSDIERCIRFLHAQQSFICKLHGSVSSIESTVLTAEDYEDLYRDAKYLSLLKNLLSQVTVVFLAYGLADDYVLGVLRENAAIKNIFGDGPHFAVLPEKKETLPESCTLIKYRPGAHKDHRESIRAISEITHALKTKGEDSVIVHKPRGPANLVSAHLLSELYPPGTWQTSHTLTLVRKSGEEKEAVVGLGFTDQEIPVTQSTAMHDLVVGLICFDHVYIPLDCLQSLHKLLAGASFEQLVKSDCLRFIDWMVQDAVFFPEPGAVTGGRLEGIVRLTQEVSAKSFEEVSAPGQEDRYETSSELIRMILRAQPSREAEAQNVFELIEQATIRVDRSRDPVNDIARGLLLCPSMRALMGLSDAFNMDSIPRWSLFPVLRLAHVVRMGVTCQQHGIASTKLEFGCPALAAPAFAASYGYEWSDNVASYVLAGRFGADVGTYVIQNPRILDGILNFRDTQVGIRLRKEVLERLSLDPASDLVVCINAGLESNLPTEVLQEARDQLAQLLVNKNNLAVPLPYLWNNRKMSEKALALWRKHSRRTLEAYCQEHGIKPYSPCPCRSGEKLKFCCRAALKA